jgi:hypothetical protein
MANGFEIKVPGHLEPGVYANACDVWHTRSEFAVDFLARPANRGTPDLALVVSRVKIPTIFVFELIRDLNTNMTEYDATFGEIVRPEWGENDGGGTA